MAPLLLSNIASGLRLPKPCLLHPITWPPGHPFALNLPKLASRTRTTMSTTPTVPPFRQDFVAKHTESPNPSFVYGQKVSETEEGSQWVEGEKAGWKVVDPATEEPASVVT